MEETYILIYSDADLSNGSYGLQYVGPFKTSKEAYDYRKATLSNTEDYRVQVISSPY